METIKVFVGVGVDDCYDGYEYGKVLKTYDNGMKLLYLEDETETDPNEDIWEQLIIAKPDDRFGWYAQDGFAIRTTMTTRYGLMFRDTIKELKEREF